VHPRLHRAVGKLQIEVIRNGAHRRVALTHQRQHRRAVAHVERRGDQPRAGVRREKGREVIEVQIGEPDLRHLGILQQIIRTCRTLKSRAENEHSHQ